MKHCHSNVLWRVTKLRVKGGGLRGVLFARCPTPTKQIITRATTLLIGLLLGVSGLASVTPAVAVAVSPTFENVFAGEYFTMALRGDGTLWSWGNNYYGQLGDGTTTNDRRRPVQTGTGSDWTAASGGVSHTLARQSDNSLWVWGKNYYGQLGDGTDINRSVPYRLSSDFTVISAGAAHSLGIRGDGSLWAWGYNWDGQLGDGTQDERYTPVKIASDLTWRTVSGAAWHSVGLKSNGTIWAWGNNTYGQLGDGTAEADSWVPIQVGTAKDWETVVAGGYHNLAIKTDGTLWAWGANSFGQLGDGTAIPRYSPVKIGTDTDWVAAAAGGYHSLALKSDGTLWSWGRNVEGQLGDGSNSERWYPAQVGGESDWTQFATGGLHSVALRADGTVWTWGGNAYGELGLGDQASRNQPTLVTFVPPAPVATKITLTAPAMTWNKSSALAGYLRDGGGMAIPGKRVLIERSIDGGKTWPDITTVTTSSTGRWAYTYNPSTSYERAQQIRVRFLGDAEYVKSSATASLAVRVTLSPPRPSVTTPTRYRTFSVTSYITPRFKPAVKPVRALFYKKQADGSWKYIKYASMTTSYYSTTKTKLKTSTTLSSAGKWRVRLRYDGAKTYRGYVLSRTYSSYVYFSVKK